MAAASLISRGPGRGARGTFPINTRRSDILCVRRLGPRGRPPWMKLDLEVDPKLLQARGRGVLERADHLVLPRRPVQARVLPPVKALRHRAARRNDVDAQYDHGGLRDVQAVHVGLEEARPDHEARGDVRGGARHDDEAGRGQRGELTVDPRGDLRRADGPTRETPERSIAPPVLDLPDPDARRARVRRSHDRATAGKVPAGELDPGGRAPGHASEKRSGCEPPDLPRPASPRAYSATPDA